MASSKIQVREGTHEIPRWLKNNINGISLSEIRAAVMRAEKVTSGEIVPMVVRSSSSFGHVGAILFLASLLFFWTFATQVASHAPQIPFWILELSSIVLAGMVTWAGKDTDFARYWLTSPRDQTASVMHRAQLEFYQSNIKSTARKTGVLIFVSLLERRAVVLADEAVAALVSDSEWETAIELLLKETRQGNLGRGLCDAIELVGQRLGQALPLNIGDRDELANDLIMKD